MNTRKTIALSVISTMLVTLLACLAIGAFVFKDFPMTTRDRRLSIPETKPSSTEEYEVLSYSPPKTPESADRGALGTWVLLHKNPAGEDTKITVHCANYKNDCDNYITVGDTIKVISAFDIVNGKDGWLVDHMGAGLLSFDKSESLRTGDDSGQGMNFGIDKEEVVSRRTR